MLASLIRKVFFVCFPLALVAASPYPQPKSFSHAVKIFKQIDFDYSRTAFTNQVYKYDATTCMDKNYVKDEPRKSVVFVRIVPPSEVLKTRKCGTKKICINQSGKAYGGAMCCRRSDDLYKSFDRDIFNIMPVVKRRPSLDIEPPLHIRGNIARVYLYINAEYGLNLSFKRQMLYLKWHGEDAVDAKECAVHKQIEAIQGRSNPWIKSSCETLTSKSSKSSQE